MPKAGKDIAGKIVDFLREKGGRAVIVQTKLARELDCNAASVSVAFHKLLDRGVVIETSGRSSKGRQMGTEIILPDEFKEGDNWRALMRRQSGRAKTEETKSAVILQPAPVGGHDGTCQQFRHAILQELVGVYKELETARKELGTAQFDSLKVTRGLPRFCLLF
jgi:hypothetical protein